MYCRTIILCSSIRLFSLSSDGDGGGGVNVNVNLMFEQSEVSVDQFQFRVFRQRRRMRFVVAQTPPVLAYISICFGIVSARIRIRFVFDTVISIKEELFLFVKLYSLEICFNTCVFRRMHFKYLPAYSMLGIYTSCASGGRFTGLKPLIINANIWIGF